ncbi:hypothetical protein G6L63_11435 [Agrobacterium vitis]|nr:hypothetical protein [Agrobacterium vitis]MCF1479167.1 hypothetical protein [Agrobacterium vitis]MUZ97745.1 hypothetical protein [Agrobacterium vitis]MVA30275.1 hypothetical protein [Agrobacterium vitis]NOJ33717.1 hypothetical protein [Agrobacterium vitis]NSZ48521.1 hypothetical protein [Agrobacterium vitis]
MTDHVPTIDEIDNVDKLAVYLATQPIQVAQIVAFRSALRILPFSYQAAFLENDIHLAGRLRVSAFRALFLCWVDLRYRNEISDLQLNIDAAAVAADSSDVAAHNASEHTAALTLVDGARVSVRAAASATHRVNVDPIHQAKRTVLGTIYVVAERPVVWSVIRRDLSVMMADGAEFLLQSPLWIGAEVPERVKQADSAFWKDISALGVQWAPVWDWYSHIKGGVLPFEDLGSRFENAVIGLAQERNEFWDRNPDVVMKDISERLTLMPPMPSEPEPGPGPHYDIIDGKLGIVASLPHSDEVNTQTKLFERLRLDVDRLVSAAHKIDNSQPNLVFSIREYAALLDTPLDTLDVTGVWAVGGSLAGFAQSFREQNRNRTLADPLEPEVDGLLQSVIRQHGAFIMGFEEGRDLVDRADRFALDSDKLHGLEESGNPLIAELASNADLVSDDARAVHKSVSDVLHDAGWTIARNCYTGFLTIRNAVRIIIKVVLGNDPNVLAVLGGVAAISTICGDPNLDFLRTAIPFLQANKQNLLAFFQHYPEMRSYIKWVLHIVRNETK